MQHAAPQRCASVAGTAHGNKPAAHGSVKKVTAKGTAKSGTKVPGASQTQSKAAVTAQAKKPHAQLVQAKPVPGKAVRANLVVPAVRLILT